MTILIANIGNSDLAINIDGYYIPIGFDRNEPNIDDSGLTEDEKVVWDQEFRNSEIVSSLCPQLGVKVDRGRYSFRELTRRILEEYEKDSQTWHDLIRPGRILGVIETAIGKYKVKDVYIFVTNQPEFIINPKTGEPEFNIKGYPTDSIHAFAIIKKWLEQEHPNINFIKKVISETIPAINQDALLDYYYGIFQVEIPREETIIVSIKGGTPQMQNALRMQALAASAFSKVLFIEPKLSITRLLAGKASECQLTSYWQYIRTQKYEDVKMLVETRWDFAGAIQILERWQELLNFWKANTEDSHLSVNQELISRAIKTLQIGDRCFNLDIQSAKEIWGNNLPIKNKLSHNLVQQVERYDRLLNLYTQCRIYEPLGQSANFLIRLSSFYEGVLEQLARKFNRFNDFPHLENRFVKRDFIEEIVRSRNTNQALEASQVIKYLKPLDFWCVYRNQLIHSSEGVSQQRMWNLYQQREQDKFVDACPPNQIIATMAQILNSDLNIIRPEYRLFVQTNAKYYIYSAVKEWVMEKLFNNG